MTNQNNSVFFIGGFGMSGSSVVSDILKETSSCHVMKGEFRLFTDPDGLSSLESALTDNWNMFQADTAIKRFLKLAYLLSHRKRKKGVYGSLNHRNDFGLDFYKEVKVFIESLVDDVYQALWIGAYTPQAFEAIVSFKRQWVKTLKTEEELKKIINGSDTLPDRAVCGNMYMANPVDEKGFLSHVHCFLDKLITPVLLKENKTNFVFDEGYAAMNPDRFMRYLPLKNKKMIVVIRNPLDIFVNIQLSRRLFIPEEVKKFIDWQKALFNRWKKIDYNQDSVLLLRFEDIVLDYENQLSKIMGFLGIDSAEHINKRKIFNPENSIKKINLAEKYLDGANYRELSDGLNDILTEYGYIKK